MSNIQQEYNGWSYSKAPSYINLNTLQRRTNGVIEMLFLSWQCERGKVSYSVALNSNDDDCLDQREYFDTYTQALHRILQITGMTEQEYHSLPSHIDQFRKYQ